MSDRRRRSTAEAHGARALGFAFVALFASGAATLSNSVHAAPSDKVFVCKYVGTPGVDEVLQTGDNPISVSVNTIPEDAEVGSFFPDAQGRSFVLAFDVGQEEPDRSECPLPEGPPTTTTVGGPTTTSPGDYPPRATTTTSPVAMTSTTVAGPGLPPTGSDNDSTLQVAVAALLAGAALVVVAGLRRRPMQP